MCFFIAFGSQMCNTDIKIKDAKAYFPSETTGVAYFRVESEVADVMERLDNGGVRWKNIPEKTQENV
mgnify:CR=1 FL=1